MSNHLRILSRLANTPLFISEDKLSILSSNVILPLLANSKPEKLGLEVEQRNIPVANPRVSIIKVFDSLVSKGGAGESGFTSYEGITKQINTAIQNGSSKIGFYIDSPGGEVTGLFPLTDLINSLPSVYGVETFSYSEQATSAAFAIANATQIKYASSTAQLGSIGVIMSLVDVTKMDEKMGVSYTILRSKDEKALYNPHESLSQDTIDKYSAMLTELDTIFNQKMVDYNPSLTVDSIKSMKGASFLTSKAFELKLVDKVVSSLDEVLKIESSVTITKGNINMTMTLEEYKARVSALETEVATLNASISNAGVQAVTNERTRCVEILQAGKALKMSDETVMKRISTGTTKEDALDFFTALAEERGNLTSIDTSTVSTSTITEANTIINPKDNIRFGDMEVSASDVINAAKALKGVK